MYGPASVPSASEVQWTGAPDRVRYVPRVIAAVIDSGPDELFEEDATRWDPPMLAIGRESVAVSERAVMHHDPANSTARTGREMCGIAAFKVNDRRHGVPPLHDRPRNECVVLVTVRIRRRRDSSRGNTPLA
jgi:hypothetical protein